MGCLAAAAPTPTHPQQIQPLNQLQKTLQQPQPKLLPTVPQPTTKSIRLVSASSSSTMHWTELHREFEDALVKLLGENHVTFNVQNAQGDSQTCATIANQFVNGGVDLIMANATAAFRPARMPHQQFLLSAHLSQVSPLHWILSWMRMAAQASMSPVPTILHRLISRHRSLLTFSRM